MLFTYSILYQGCEVACAEAERFEDAREQAINDAVETIYGDALDECEFVATCDTGVIGTVSGPVL